MFFWKRADANTTSGPTVPLAIEPSGNFEGNDGKWSTFYINLGDDGTGHGQNFRVLPFLSSPVTMVPAQSEWCNQDCAAKRGMQIFNGEQPLGYETDSSKAWVKAGIYEIPRPDWWNPGELNGTLGRDNVGLGQSSSLSPVLASQFVMTYTSGEYYLGSFGLAAGTLAAGNSQTPPFLFNFARGPPQLIPSVSFGYTAGASYRNDEKGVTGNLILGGYDASRVKVEKGASIKMPSQQNNTLVVGVQSIIYTPDPDKEANAFSFTDESKGFLATIDSTLPYLYLPDAVCDEFAERFGLVYDEKHDIYTVNSTAHQTNVNLNATVSFRIGTGPDASDPFASIELPYAAFYYTIDQPLVENATEYFPIKKSPNGIYVLGRTFLQESYVIVDYERWNFTVAPVLYSQNTDEHDLVPIWNTTYSPSVPTPTSIASGGGSGLSPGAVAGIVVGVVVVLLLAGLAFFFRWKKRQAKRQLYAEKSGEEIDTSLAGGEVKHRRVSELDSEPPNSPKSSIAGLYGRDQKDVVPFPPINEMESPPAELYSPPPLSSTHSDGNGIGDYFLAGKVRRRGATRESSGNNTPGTPDILGAAPLAELPGDDGKYQGSPVHSRGPSDTSLQSKIDEVMTRPEKSPQRDPEAHPDAIAEAEKEEDKKEEKEEGEAQPEVALERRASHTRGLSDTTVQSDTTVVSQPTPEELEQWALGGEEGPRRPLSE
ncbi:acid protease [Lentithecium fluviatile CBS 122367]|uniref:Acid protease n=1 Tax=Lentithecium fluviatile CBS 122367 TaxID=1168545 RepID=A0A6G1JCS1_9PLEO|nr:acid protease [Lentithecium fluviatile CBS 122367]